MARRHRSLVRLSQEHHHTLALALRLVQGGKALLNAGWTHDNREQARRVESMFEHELKRHFSAEEEVLFPAMGMQIAESVPIIEVLRGQHREIGSVVDRLHSTDAADLASLLASLGTLLERHIRLEERQLFPLYESRIPEDIAEAVERDIERRY
jgi:iron-sulfur cluster repair protein YtfE (RIC family)